MRGIRLGLIGLLFICALAGCGEDASRTAQGEGSGPQAAAPTSIDQLYSLPSIIGTTPEGAVWSPDGKTLAFLWNDAGYPFRDVWLYSVDKDRPTRLTRHGAEQAPDSEHKGISEVVWLGDGARLAYVLDGAAYVLGTDGTTRPLADAGAGAGVKLLQASPAGNRLAWLANGNLWVKDLKADSPAHAVVKPGKERVFVERYEWSANGQQLAFMLTDDRGVREIDVHYSSGGEQKTYRTTRPFPGDATSKRRVGVVAAGGGSITWFDRPDPEDPVWGFGLSADGTRLFVDSSDDLIKERTIYVYDVANAKSVVFFKSKDPKQVWPAWSAEWAPGDKGLIIVSDHEGWFHLYYQQEPGAPARALTSGDWEVASFEVDSSHGFVYFLANAAHPAELQLYRVPVAGGKPERLTQQPGTHAAAFSRDFSSFADLFSSDTSPPDLFVQTVTADAASRRVTHSPRPEFAQLPLAEVSYVEFKSHVDGTALLGRLSVPRNFDPKRKYPLLMGSIYPNSVRNRWGAGNAIPTWGLDQHLVERGYLLMKVDVRGSWGHGKKMRQGLFGDYGGLDKDDVQSGALHLIKAGHADPDRVGIWGWSYGGLMTLMSLFKNPDFYAVGIADAPATNVAHAFPSQMWVMGRPEGADFPERYRRMSALNFTEGLKSPLMITHATRDWTVLYADTIDLTERLMANDKSFELVSLPGSSHVWANDSRDQQRFGYKKMVEFFDRYLKP
jgi:Dipeptidyl aminopeptidases/acylaminoacyl-peptidases